METFECKRCHESFSSAWELGGHCKVEHGRCRVCDAVIEQGEKAKQHMLTHPKCSPCRTVSESDFCYLRTKPHQRCGAGLCVNGPPTSAQRTETQPCRVLQVPTM